VHVSEQVNGRDTAFVHSAYVDHEHRTSRKKSTQDIHSLINLKRVQCTHRQIDQEREGEALRGVVHYLFSSCITSQLKEEKKTTGKKN
jgi:hypothetical protein